MQLTPVYGDQPIIEMDGILDDPSIPMLRQRNRLADLVAGFDEAQWTAETRCDGWSVQDVISHLVTVNQFWTFSIGCGLAGKPTQVLASFDPVASPAQLVAAVRSKGPQEVLDEYVASNEALAAALGMVDDEGWSVLAEAPPGHIAIRLVALHGLWDGWVHERDIALPQGLSVVEEPDEIVGSLSYVLALGPAYDASKNRQDTREGTLEVVATDPEVRVIVDVGPTIRVHAGAVGADAVRLTGNAVELIESLSFRTPFTASIAAIAEEDRWLLGNLAEVFDLVD